MLQLLLIMFERIAIIVMVAFLMTRVHYFRTVIEERHVTNVHRFVVMLMFGVFGIIGSYTGVAVDVNTIQVSKWTFPLNENEAIANSRVIGVVIGGLLGGWRVGLGAGVIAGVHRISLGGFTAIACGLSTIIAGIISGIVHRYLPKKNSLSPIVALIVGSAAESIQMVMILLISRPFDDALILVQVIGIPMIIANGIGSAVFILIIRNVFYQEEKAGAFQAQKSLLLAKLTTAHLRDGLTEQSAHSTCELLLYEVNASAVAITDRHKILAHVGLGNDHHHCHELIQTEGTKNVLIHGKLLAAGRESIDCQVGSCPLQAAVIAPLKKNNETIGTLKFYFTSEEEIKKVTVEFIKGLSSLLSQHLEMADAKKYYQLAKEAEIKALQAQVNPHFLFNTLNTIVSMIRIEPLKARKLLIALSRYFRHNLAGVNEELISLTDELDHVKAYLDIEKARFKDKLVVVFDVEATLLYMKIPPMTLQPLIENAMKHGFKGVKEGSTLKIVMKHKKHGAHVSVVDNGVGVERSKLEMLTKRPVESQTGTGLGLHNVNRRLTMLFGEAAKLNIKSSQNQGTTISFLLPFSQNRGETYEAKN